MFTPKEIEEKVLKIVLKDGQREIHLVEGYIAQAKRFKTAESICIQMELCVESLSVWLTTQHLYDTKANVNMHI